MDIRDVKLRYMMYLDNELICCTFADGHVNAYEPAVFAREGYYGSHILGGAPGSCIVHRLGRFF